MPFVPTGYLTLTAAIDRVVELRQGVDGSPLLTEDERATLRKWQNWRDQLSRPQPKPVTPVPKAGDTRTPGKKYPHRLVEAEPQRPDVNLEEIKDLLEKEPPFKEQQRAAGEVLRQLLYAGRVPSEIITGEGPRIETPQYIWGGGQWHEALSLKNITFRSSILSVTGFPVIPRDALEAAFNSDGTVKEEPLPELKQEVKPQEKPQATPEAQTDQGSEPLSETELGLKGRAQAVLEEGQRRQAGNRYLSIRRIASAMVQNADGGKIEGWGEDTVRKILAGRYEPVSSLGLKGLGQE